MATDRVRSRAAIRSDNVASENDRPAEDGRGRAPTGQSDRSAGHDHGDMLRRWIWRDFANITLGVWLLSSPFTLGYTDRPLVWSDLVSGGLIVVLARSAEPALRQTAIILPARWSSRGR